MYQSLHDSKCGSFPDLRILPTQSLFLREQADVQRVDPIMECLAKQGILRDPPIVATPGNNGPQYVVLDGADYVIALRKMNIPHILGQVVEPGDSAVPRALRVNYLLSELMAGKSLTEKNDALQQWLQARILERGVRCYEEATILFDE